MYSVLIQLLLIVLAMCGTSSAEGTFAALQMQVGLTVDSDHIFVFDDSSVIGMASMPATPQLTFSCWVNVAPVSILPDPTFLFYRGTAFTSGFGASLSITPSGTVTVGLAFAQASTTTPWSGNNATANLLAGRWAFLSVLVDFSQAIDSEVWVGMYVNGQHAFSASLSAPGSLVPEGAGSGVFIGKVDTTGFSFQLASVQVCNGLPSVCESPCLSLFVCMCLCVSRSFCVSSVSYSFGVSAAVTSPSTTGMGLCATSLLART